MSERVSTQPVNGAETLPHVLTQKHTWLFKLGGIVADLRERHPDDPDEWKPAHVAFERHMKQACPRYRRLKGEFAICDSGREGNYFRGPEVCSTCQFLNSDVVPPKPELIQVAPAPALLSPALTPEQTSVIVAKTVEAVLAKLAPKAKTRRGRRGRKHVAEAPVASAVVSSMDVAPIRQAAREFAEQAAVPVAEGVPADPIPAVPVPVSYAAAQLSAWASGKQPAMAV